MHSLSAHQRPSLTSHSTTSCPAMYGVGTPCVSASISTSIHQHNRIGKKSGIQGKFCFQNANRNSSRFHLSLEISTPCAVGDTFPALDPVSCPHISAHARCGARLLDRERLPRAARTEKFPDSVGNLHP